MIETSRGVTFKNLAVISDIPANGEIINEIAADRIKINAIETEESGSATESRILPNITARTKGWMPHTAININKSGITMMEKMPRWLTLSCKSG